MTHFLLRAYTSALKQLPGSLLGQPTMCSSVNVGMNTGLFEKISSVLTATEPR